MESSVQTHSLNTHWKGEKKTGEFHVDGFSETDGVQTAFKFLGHFFHGCPLCFHLCDTCLLRDITFKELYVVMRQKLEQLKLVYGVQIVLMREMKKTKKVRKRFPTGVWSSQALYSSRTCTFMLRHTCWNDKEFYYVDVILLYPFINCHYAYPLRHPSIIHKDFDEIPNYFGFIRTLRADSISLCCLTKRLRASLCLHSVALVLESIIDRVCAHMTAKPEHWQGSRSLLNLTKLWSRGTEWVKSQKSGIFSKAAALSLQTTYTLLFKREKRVFWLSVPCYQWGKQTRVYLSLLPGHSARCWQKRSIRFLGKFAQQNNLHQISVISKTCDGKELSRTLCFAGFFVLLIFQVFHACFPPTLLGRFTPPVALFIKAWLL